MAKAWKFGSNIDTDVILSGRYLNRTEPEFFAAHCLEDLDPDFARTVKPGDLIVAGGNFGCGSSREHAPIAIKAAGVKAVIAESYARIFFRNALNIGLPILECPEAVAGIDFGDEVEVDLLTGVISNISKGKEFQSKPLPIFMRELIQEGGLVAYAKKKHGQGVQAK